MKIEKGIPPPLLNKKTSKQIKSTYPLNAMEIGDSFFVKSRIKRTHSSRLAMSIYRYKNTVSGKGKNFTQKQQKGGIRVWRIK